MPSEDRIPMRFEDDPHLPGYEIPGLQRLAEQLRAAGRPVPPPFPGERPDPLAPPEGYGERRTGQANAAEPTDTLCAADRESPRSPLVCTREHEFVWMFGDKAEHIMPVELCREHSEAMAADLARGGFVTCAVCMGVCRLERVVSRETGEDAGYLAVIEAARSSVVQRALDRLAWEVS